MIISQHLVTLFRHIGSADHPAANGIIKIMAQVGDNISIADNAALGGFRQVPPISGNHLAIALGVFGNAVTHLIGQIQALATVFQGIDHPQALPVMGKAAGHQFIEDGFTGMAEGGMTEIMAVGNGLDQIFIESHGASDGAGYLAHLQGMGEPGPVMIAGRRQKNLRFMLETPVRLTVNNPVPVSLKSTADGALLLMTQSPLALATQASEGESICCSRVSISLRTPIPFPVGQPSDSACV